MLQFKIKCCCLRVDLDARLSVILFVFSLLCQSNCTLAQTDTCTKRKDG